MKIINNFLVKVGTDKVLHFLVLALLTAYATILGVEYMWGMMILSPFVGVFKELFDSRFSGKDIIAGILGSIFTVAMYWILQLA